MSIAVYIVNDNPVYISMLANSLQMLRERSTIPIRVFFVDNQGIRQDVVNVLEIFEHILPIRTKEALFDLCEKLGVEVWQRKLPEMKEHPDYAPVHRLLLQECPEQNILFLDADTFIFEDVYPLFDYYKDYDFVATPNAWGEHNKLRIKDVDLNTFNSGVVIWNNGSLQRYAAALHDICWELFEGRHEFSEWLKKENPHLGGREELACNLFVIENGLKYKYFERRHCATHLMREAAAIFHTTTPYYPQYIRQYHKKKLNKKIYHRRKGT